MKNLKKIREQKGFSQRELGEKAGVTGGTIHYYENCTQTRQPGVNVAYKMAQALGVRIETLLGRNELYDLPD